MTGKQIVLKASDGFELAAYRADPQGRPKGGIVVVQEAFGVNHHIRHVADGYAQHGYLAIAPAMFDRVERGFEAGYEQADLQRAMAIRQKLDLDKSMLDVAAAVKAAGENGLHVGIVGYCYGGLVAWLSAGKVDGLSGAVGYYGGGTAKALDIKPKIPVMLHFGEHDAHIPMTEVNQIREKHPEVTIYAYNADHGFNCTERPSFDKDAATLAFQRTLDFFIQHVG